jgi:glycine/sarcosine N-methyltransferase
MDDLYADFAARYDLPYGLTGMPDLGMLKFFGEIFAQNKVSRVLDCACGTGRHLMLFHQLGCVVHGSDVSPSMLEQAKANLAGAGVEIPLRQADFRCLPEIYEERFDAVICLAAIGYMPDEAQFLKAFESIAGVLREDGILVLSAIPTDRQWQEKPKFSLAADTPNCTRIFVMDYFEKAVRYHILDLLRYPAGTEMKTWSAEITVLLRDDQERLLKSAGFQQVDFFGGYDFSPYDKAASNQMIAVSRK